MSGERHGGGRDVEGPGIRRLGTRMSLGWSWGRLGSLLKGNRACCRNKISLADRCESYPRWQDLWQYRLDCNEDAWSRSWKGPSMWVGRHKSDWPIKASAGTSARPPLHHQGAVLVFLRQSAISLFLHVCYNPRQRRLQPYPLVEEGLNLQDSGSRFDRFGIF